MSLCSHELFHTWHVKRIRPQELAESDLSEETYTEQLWIYEGFTSYYDDLSLVRSGVIDEQDYLELMGQNLTRLNRNVGRLKQTVTESSFYAWNKFYKQDASAINNIVSYYNKGAVIAMCLDLLIKKQSDNKLSLDDVMRRLWREYGCKDIGTPPEVVHIILHQLGVDVEEYLHSALYSTDDLPTSELLALVGIKEHHRAKTSVTDKGGKAADSTEKIHFGANFKKADTGVHITQITQVAPLNWLAFSSMTN